MSVSLRDKKAIYLFLWIFYAASLNQVIFIKQTNKKKPLELDSLTSPMEMTSFNCVSVLCPWFFSRVYVRNNHLEVSSHQRHEYGRRFSVQSWGASVRISLVLVRGSSARVGRESGDLHSKPSSAFWKHWGLSLNCLFWALVSLLVERDCKRASTSQDCFKTNNLKSLVQCLALWSFCLQWLSWI